MSERGRFGLVVVAAALALAVVVLTVRWAAEDRPFTASVPQPPPLDATALVSLGAGQTACLTGVTVLPRSEVGTLRIGTGGRPPVPLGWRLRGPGYEAAGRIAPTWTDNVPLTFGVRPPARSLHADFCVRNEGRRGIDLYGATGEPHTVSVTEVDGRRVEPNFQLAFAERAPHSVATRIGEIARSVSAFRPVAPWMLWPLGLLVVAGLPALLAWALWRAAGEDAP